MTTRKLRFTETQREKPAKKGRFMNALKAFGRFLRYGPEPAAMKATRVMTQPVAGPDPNTILTVSKRKAPSATPPARKVDVDYSQLPDRELDLNPLTMGKYAFADRTPKPLSDEQKTELLSAIRNCELDAPATGNLSRNLLRLISANTVLPEDIRKAAQERLTTPPA